VFFVHQSFTFREVRTNTLTGEWFVVSGHSTTRDVKATRVAGSVYEVTQVLSGQPFVVTDSSGRVVLRDRGSIRFHYTFDTGGDNQPGGQAIDFLGVEVHGPHPGFTTTDCRIAGDLVGISDSSQRYTLHPAGTTAAPLGYAAYLPASYGQGKSPLLVFLHGSGESGDGSAEQLGNLALQAIPKYIANDGWPDARPFVVLSPQHEDTSWVYQDDYSACDDVEFPGSCGTTVQHNLGNPTPGSACFTPQEVASFISYAVGAYNVDPKRVYLTGISCGAFGAWEYVAEHRDQVAAVIPIAGEGRPAWSTAGCALGEVALWAFHGEQDDVVNPAGSVETMNHVKSCAAHKDARLTTYPDADHDSWTGTYTVGAKEDIYGWLLGISRP